MLGLGASNQRWMEDELGIPFVRPLRRLADAGLDTAVLFDSLDAARRAVD